MMPNLTRLLSDVLSLPDDALVYEVSRRLHDLFPDKCILETEDYDFKLAEYAAAGKCMIHLLDDAFGHVDAVWLGLEEGIAFEPKNGFFEIQWRGLRLHCLSITYNGALRHFLISDRRDEALELFRSVCSLEVDARGEILVFRNGHWRRDAELMRQISETSLETVVMPAAMREDLLRNVEGFFSMRDLYDRHGLSWKRGLLLLGEPGNGKTLTIKGLVNRLGVPCLYVRSFKAERITAQRCIANVFGRAREVAPCVLVLEDLDSLIDQDDLAFLLNELDGFAANRGILTIATTNHPERLDPALLHRPSRFDRKIEFKDPALEERRRYLDLANRRREPSTRLTPEELEETALASAGFSYAYLEELDLAATLSCLSGDAPSIGQAMSEAVETLRGQIRRAEPDEE
jgi:hypothetical protein